MNQNKKIYLITYSTDIPFNSNVIYQRMNDLLHKRHITDWWYYIDNTYLVACSLDVNELYNLIYSAINRHLLIVEINPKNAQGWLPQDAWNWINKYINF
ncbi:MAG: hypothetical protein OXH36_04450 [Bdellovibrionales bacterium]|nr:hypothetical protein [Bdellovibrionales bacterium]